MNDHEHASLWRDPRERWRRDNQQLWLRHDWERFYTPRGAAEMRARMGLDPRTGRRAVGAAERKYSPTSPASPPAIPTAGNGRHTAAPG